MSLFKVLKGESSRISTEVTPFHDGWAYFTTDDCGFYIDAENNGVEKRYKVNGGGGGAEEVSTVLLAGGWENNVQTLPVAEITSGANGSVAPAQNITAEQMEAIGEAKLHVTGQADGAITVTAFGTAPALDIPIIITILK